MSTTPTTPNSDAPNAFRLDIEPRTFPLASVLRRCAWYAAIGMLVVATIAALISFYTPDPDPEKAPTPAGKALTFSLIVLIGLAVLVAAYSWRLHIDATGMHRDFLFFFRRTWTWDQFRSGTVLFRKRDKDKRHPSFSESLILDEPDVEWVLSIIDTVWVPSELPDPPPRLELKHRAKVKRNPLVLHEAGIDAFVDGTARSYSWADVKSVMLTRGNPREQGFRACTLALPHGELTLETNHDKTNWRGASDRVVEAFLRAHLPAEVLTVSDGDVPVSLADYDARIAKLKKTIRGFKFTIPVCAMLVAGIQAWKAYQARDRWTWEATVAFLIFLGYWGLFLSAPVFLYVRCRRQLKQLEAEREAFLNDSNPSP